MIKLNIKGVDVDSLVLFFASLFFITMATIPYFEPTKCDYIRYVGDIYPMPISIVTSLISFGSVLVFLHRYFSYSEKNLCIAFVTLFVWCLLLSFSTTDQIKEHILYRNLIWSELSPEDYIGIEQLEKRHPEITFAIQSAMSNGKITYGERDSFYEIIEAVRAERNKAEANAEQAKLRQEAEWVKNKFATN